VIEWLPAANVAIAICAELLDTVAVPSDVDPSRNVTVPVAEVPVGGWIVADRETDCPYVEGLRFVATVVLVVA